MSDFDDDRDPDPAETRHVLRQVAEYRRLRDAVRKKAMGSILSGALMLAIWYFLDGQFNRWTAFSIIYLSLALLEVCVGLLNRLWPSAEGLLLDGLVLLTFAASSLVRQYLAWQMFGNRAVNPALLLFGGLWAYQGLQTVRGYFRLRASLPARPTREHLRWFDDLVRDLRHADPRDDASALAVPTDPFLTGKLLGDNAFFLDPHGHVLIAAREDVSLERVESGDPERPPRGYLSVDGAEYPPFKLSEANWNNYVAWKREGGEDPLASEETPAG